jgi:hypothetical protein
MTTSASIQYRGHCQWCGRQQAVVKGLMSKHGYKVELGWFSGICSGEHFVPMEQSIEQTGIVIRTIQKQCIELQEDIEKLLSGAIKPQFCKGAWDRTIMNYAPIPFEDASQREQKATIESTIWAKKARISAGESFAAMLESISKQVYGQSLIEAQKPVAPEPIRSGERRKSEAGFTMIAKYQDGARVYWVYDGKEGSKPYWTGAQAWRKLAII